MKKDSSPVRLGVPFDEDPLMALLSDMLREEAIDSIDELKVRMVLRNLLKRRGGVVGVIRGDSGIEGTIGLALDQLYYSSADHLSKLWLYVPVAHRQTSHAKAMLMFSKMFSDSVGIPLIAEEIVMPGTERRLGMVERQMPAFGRVFLYNQRSQRLSA